ncbi:MAG TPA: FtsX-like permease family protein [Puia sp.]|nr:FtsX-like permease family protein [Puia sp.]
MRLPINTRIAQVYLFSKLKQTVIAILGVTFGISMYVFMNSFMRGVNEAQNRLAFSTLAHVHVYNDRPPDRSNLVRLAYPPGTIANIRDPKVIKYTEGIRNSKEIIHYIRQQPEVTAIAPEVNVNVFFKNVGNKINGTLSGVNVAAEDRLFGSAAMMTVGNWKELARRPDGIILGAELGENLSISVGDNLNILTSDGVSRTYKVIGMLRTNLASVDRTKAYVSIGAARQLLARNQDYVTDIQVQIKDFEEARPLAYRMAAVIPYKVESWQMANAQLEAGSNLRDVIALATSLTILIVAGFGIYNIMNMMINEKIREIAILKAMGFAGLDIRRIFLTQGTVIGVIGGIFGMGLGWAVSAAVNSVPFNVAGLATLPMSYDPTDYSLAFFFGLITTFIAGYMPARKASRIDPVTIIRG